MADTPTSSPLERDGKVRAAVDYLRTKHAGTTSADRVEIVATALAALQEAETKLNAAEKVVSEWDAVHGPWNDPHATDEEIETAEKRFYDSIEDLATVFAAADHREDAP